MVLDVRASIQNLMTNKTSTEVSSEFRVGFAGDEKLLYGLGCDETAHACVGSGVSDDTRAAQNGTQKREAEFRAGTEQYGPGLLARRSRTAKHIS